MSPNEDCFTFTPPSLAGFNGFKFFMFRMWHVWRLNWLVLAATPQGRRLEATVISKVEVLLKMSHRKIAIQTLLISA